ncbi:MAG: hypothetical protein WC641_03545 [Patescibacteria group bacterium]
MKALIKFILALAGFCLVAVLAFLFVGWPKKTADVTYGASFSRPYAEELGLDPNKVLTAALTELNIKRFRIPAYFKLVEPERGKWDFAALDEQVKLIRGGGGQIILAVGEKLPRWPECWGPDWWKKLPREEQRQETLRYIEAVVTRYRESPAIMAWQIENEPHFAYGDCPAPEMLFIRQETNFVRGLDPKHEILTTDSGELSSWLTLGVFVDRLGVSVYRVVRNPLFGNANLHYWFLPPYFYARKALLLRPFGVKSIYVSEFQMEPWSNKPLNETPIQDQLGAMDLKQMRSNFSFAERMGIKAVDFWGLEWWAWMKEKGGHPEFWDEAVKFFKAANKR